MPPDPPRKAKKKFLVAAQLDKFFKPSYRSQFSSLFEINYHLLWEWQVSDIYMWKKFILNTLVFVVFFLRSLVHKGKRAPVVKVHHSHVMNPM